ncbi:MAG: hypothetical protein ABID09_05360 [Candidatus Omnitrophota bacterium]
MKTHSFPQIIGLSWNRMVLILFRPYILRKWIMLLIIAMLAGYFGGFNFSLNLKGNRPGRGRITSQGSKTTFSTPGDIKISWEEVKQNAEQTFMKVTGRLKGNPLFLGLLAASVAGIVIVPFLILFIRAVFQFILIESLVKNDPSVRIPYHRNKEIGSSYLSWNIMFGAAVIAGSIAIIFLSGRSLWMSGVFSNISTLSVKSILVIIGPYIIPFLLFLSIAILIRTFSSDFITVIMYSGRVGVMRSWGTFLKLLAKNAIDVILYLLLKILFMIISIIVLLLLFFVAALIILLLGGGMALIGSLIYAVTPMAAKLPVSIIMAAIGAPLYILLFLAACSITIPVPVFFRLFSIYFIASINGTLDPFAKPFASSVTKEDMNDYRRPLFLLWLSILSPILLVILILSTVIVGATSLSGDGFFKRISLPPYLTKTKRQTGMIKPPEPLLSSSTKKTIDETDTIYLKNGRSLKGMIVRESNKAIILRIPGGTTTISRENIDRIEYKDGIKPKDE